MCASQGPLAHAGAPPDAQHAPACALTFLFSSYATDAMKMVLLLEMPSGLSTFTRKMVTTMQMDTGQMMPVISSPRSSSTDGCPIAALEEGERCIAACARDPNVTPPAL